MFRECSESLKYSYDIRIQRTQFDTAIVTGIIPPQIFGETMPITTIKAAINTFSLFINDKTYETIWKTRPKGPQDNERLSE